MSNVVEISRLPLFSQCESDNYTTLKPRLSRPDFQQFEKKPVFLKFFVAMIAHEELNKSVLEILTFSGCISYDTGMKKCETVMVTVRV